MNKNSMLEIILLLSSDVELCKRVIKGTDNDVDVILAGLSGSSLISAIEISATLQNLPEDNPSKIKVTPELRSALRNLGILMFVDNLRMAIKKGELTLSDETAEAARGMLYQRVLNIKEGTI